MSLNGSWPLSLTNSIRVGRRRSVETSPSSYTTSTISDFPTTTQVSYFSVKYPTRGIQSSVLLPLITPLIRGNGNHVVICVTTSLVPWSSV